MDMSDWNFDFDNLATSKLLGTTRSPCSSNVKSLFFHVSFLELAVLTPIFDSTLTTPTISAPTVVSVSTPWPSCSLPECSVSFLAEMYFLLPSLRTSSTSLHCFLISLGDKSFSSWVAPNLDMVAKASSILTCLNGWLTKSSSLP
uniref:Uncharacterized protein n=1 Tax=Romanomermis culicivorax TaxID=13658 RepID=A0A915K1G5_ROMCU